MDVSFDIHVESGLSVGPEYINCYRNKINDVLKKTGIAVSGVRWVIFDGPLEKVQSVPVPQSMQNLAKEWWAKRDERTRGKWNPADNSISVSIHIIQEEYNHSMLPSPTKGLHAKEKSDEDNELAEVIIHELVHAKLRENHTTRFWQLFDRYLTKYNQA